MLILGALLQSCSILVGATELLLLSWRAIVKKNAIVQRRINRCIAGTYSLNIFLFWSPAIRQSARFIKFRNVVQRISRLWNWEMLCRDRCVGRWEDSRRCEWQSNRKLIAWILEYLGQIITVENNARFKVYGSVWTCVYQILRCMENYKKFVECHKVQCAVNVLFCTEL